MDRQEVKSSQIKSIGHDQTTNKMEIEFAGGAIYQYSNVDKEEFDTFLNAESIGKHFGATFKNDMRYPFEKVRESDRNLKKMETQNGA